MKSIIFTPFGHATSGGEMSDSAGQSVLRSDGGRGQQIGRVLR